MSAKSSHVSSILRLTQKPQTPVSMKALLDSGAGRLLGRRNSMRNSQLESQPSNPVPIKKLALLQTASFLRREMPIRFAHRIRDLEKLPYELSSMPSIKGIQNDYLRSADEILNIREGYDSDEETRQVLMNIFSRHGDTLVEVARGLQEFKTSPSGMQVLGGTNDLSDLSEVHSWLDRFFISRIGIRTLLGHYLELSEQIENPKKNYVGIICRKTSPYDVCLTATRDAQYMCERQYGESPEVEVLGRIDLTMAYVPSHLYYILFELLKNSMRAVVEHHSNSGIIGSLPDIRVVIADGEDNEDVAIKISDYGGGIPRSISKKIFSYLFTTAGPVSPDLEGLEDFGRENPLAGLGYGLPISRAYLRYFGGDLVLMSMEGHGTDSFVHLSRLTDNEEPLP
mmetsp:Transcript_1155/g.1361  ORF Transcript_1155/g.1361 Transcript_1155/m.1361 type:complete len:397 (-) Transcript_1155:1109-2299(-)